MALERVHKERLKRAGLQRFQGPLRLKASTIALKTHLRASAGNIRLRAKSPAHHAKLRKQQADAYKNRIAHEQVGKKVYAPNTPQAKKAFRKRLIRMTQERITKNKI